MSEYCLYSLFSSGRFEVRERGVPGHKHCVQVVPMIHNTRHNGARKKEHYTMELTL